MNDLPFDSIPPNVQHLQRVQEGVRLEAEPDETSIDEFFFTTNPFSHTLSKHIQVRCEDPTFGLRIGRDELMSRAYIADIAKNTSAAKFVTSLSKTRRSEFKGAFHYYRQQNPSLA